jgi:hypothetical protein
MAHRQSVVAGNEPDLEVIDFYGIDEAVGTNAPDPRADDVTLVEWFIQQVYDNGNKINPPLTMPNLPRLKVTGRPSANLNKWIKQFQLDNMKRGTPLVADGRVDTCKTVTGVSTISHTIYTIVWLNHAMRVVRPEIKTKPMSEIPDAPDLLKVLFREPDNFL